MRCQPCNDAPPRRQCGHCAADERNAIRADERARCEAEHAAEPATERCCAAPACVVLSADFGITDSKGRVLSGHVTVTLREDGTAHIRPQSCRDGVAFGAIQSGRVVPADQADAEAVKGLQASAKRYARLAATGKL